jgi:hypothetical protein
MKVSGVRGAHREGEWVRVGGGVSGVREVDLHPVRTLEIYLEIYLVLSIWCEVCGMWHAVCSTVPARAYHRGGSGSRTFASASVP